MTEQYSLIGDRLDALGLKAEISDDHQVIGALVILKVVNFQASAGRDPHLIIATDEGTDWIDTRGLLHSAREIFEQTRAERAEESES
jgi:hypothetical protein